MYLEIMKELDVEINLSKSLVSEKGFCEFAKRFVSRDENLSGASLLEFTSLKEGFSNLIALVKRYNIPQQYFNRLLGRGTLSQGHFHNILRSKRINSNFIDSVLYNLSIYKPESLFLPFTRFISY
jgi:hypothetical protein